jgi:hypothetical protein
MNTLELIERAAKSPNLSAPGRCQYVDPNGKHCIVGEVLSILGVSDETLIGKNAPKACDVSEYVSNNQASIDLRKDLLDVIELNNLSLELLASAQKAFDDGEFDFRRFFWTMN